MKTRYAVDAFRGQVEGREPHTHLMAVGTYVCEDDAEPTQGAITLRNVNDEGDVCHFRGVVFVVRRSVCKICREAMLGVTPGYIETFLPEGRVGVESPDPPPC